MASILMLITLPYENELPISANSNAKNIEQEQEEFIDGKINGKVDDKPQAAAQTESEINESEATSVKSGISIATTTTPSQVDSDQVDSWVDVDSIQSLENISLQTFNDIDNRISPSKSGEINTNTEENGKILEDKANESGNTTSGKSVSPSPKKEGNEDEADVHSETESTVANTVSSGCEDSVSKEKALGRAVKFTISDDEYLTANSENHKEDVSDKADDGKENRPELQSHFSMEDWESTEPNVQNVKKCLEAHKIKDAIWRTSDDKEYIQVNFVVDAGETCEDVLQDLTKMRVGAAMKTSISMFPATYHCKAVSESIGESSDNEEESSKMEEFRKSIKSRLLVQEVVESIRANSKLTFDYIVLIVLASMIAGMGLVENSSVILVASMLISPLMGPIMAGTFGFVIQNVDLRNTGVKLEVIGLSICVLCGIIMGLIFGLVCLSGAVWGSSDNWPTAEMISRGQLRSLWAGILIALPSGAGVALSILGGNAGSLVGVAISASLLPPAVNAGVFWGNAIIHFISPPNVIDNGTYVVSSFHGSDCLPFENNGYVPVYSCSAAVDFLALGVVSLSLTLINILFIFIASIGVLKIKEVAPHTAASPADQKFWKKDIRVARQSYSTVKGPNSLNLKKQFMDELSKCSKQSDRFNSYNLRHMVQNISNNPDVKNVTNKLTNASPLRFVWSSDSLAPPRGYPDVYQTVRNRRSQSPDASVYETITSYYGPNRVTHKVIKRAPKLSVTDETETDMSVTQNNISDFKTDSLRNKKNLKLKIPKVQIRKNSSANISSNRAFIVTTVPDSPDNELAEAEDVPPSENDSLM